MPKSNTGSNIEVAEPQVFNKKILDFITVCKLFLRIRMREAVVEKQIQWVLSYIQGKSADMWKKNMLDDLELENLEYEIVEDFLVELKKKFGGGDKEAAKVAELKRLE